MRFFIYVVALLMSCAFSAKAAIYPVPQSIKYTFNVAEGNVFEIVWGEVEVPDLDKPPISEYDTIILAARAVGVAGSLLTGGGFSNSTAHSSGWTWALERLYPDETMADAAARFKIGLPTRIDTRNIMTNKILDGCIGVVFMNRNNISWSNVFSPAGTCITIPPVTETAARCKIITPSITLDHGQVGLGKTISTMTSADLIIDCDKEASANIKFDSSVLKLGSLISNLSVSNLNNGVVKLMQGNNNLSVVSSLTGTAISVGAFSASTVLTVTFN
ncbi:hypothetical protein [Klebsiella aerogenes]|uniref:hypothetical protein n=1 Tax=Klebsiella aerogenes TaxID=548 RepID=UPI00396793D0